VAAGKREFLNEALCYKYDKQFSGVKSGSESHCLTNENPARGTFQDLFGVRDAISPESQGLPGVRSQSLASW
jgi:hypothetical protein